MLYLFIILGEALKRLSPEFRLQHPEFPFGPATGMRNILIHSYDDVDLRLVWATATQKLPGFLASVQPLLAPSEEA